MATITQTVIIFEYVTYITAALAFFLATLHVNLKYKKERVETNDILFKKYTYVTLAALAAQVPYVIMLVQLLMIEIGIPVPVVAFYLEITTGTHIITASLGPMIAGLARLASIFYFYYLIDKHMFRMKMFLVPAIAMTAGLALTQLEIIIMVLTGTMPGFVLTSIGELLKFVAFCVLIAGYVFLIVKRPHLRITAVLLLVGLIGPTIVHLLLWNWRIQVILDAMNNGTFAEAMDLLDLLSALISTAFSIITFAGVYAYFKSSNTTAREEEEDIENYQAPDID